MGVLGHFYGKYKRSKNFVKKPFNKKNLFPKKEKKKKNIYIYINHLHALADARSTAKKLIFFTICAPYAYHTSAIFSMRTIRV